MSGLATSNIPVDPVASNPSQPSITSSTTTPDASRREPAPSTAGTTELAGQSVTALSEQEQKKLETAKKLVIDSLRFVPDFPIPGINFIDILPIFQNPVAFESLLEVLVLLTRERFGNQIPDVIVGLEARGFLFGPSLALRLNRPFVPVRKKGKMPGACITVEYKKEYGKDEFQVQTDAIKPGQTCLIVDDIIATGELTSSYTHSSLPLFFGSSPLGFSTERRARLGYSLLYRTLVRPSVSRIYAMNAQSCISR